MDSTAIRSRLDALIASRGEDYASLSRLLGRNASYVQQFIKRGVPRRLSESDRRILASHFGIAEHLLGGFLLELINAFQRLHFQQVNPCPR